MVIETKIFYYVEGSSIQQNGKWIKVDRQEGYQSQEEAIAVKQEYEEALEEIGQSKFGWYNFRLIKETQQITREVIS